MTPPVETDPAHRSTRQVRTWTRAALFAALAVANGLILVAVPNVELMTATIAVAGLLLGPGHGFLVGVVAAGLFGAINPLGSSIAIPSLWIAQMFAQGGTGFVFGLLRGPLGRAVLIPRIILFAALGAMVTVAYQVLVTISFWLFLPHNEMTLSATLLAGLAFSLVQIITNTLIFAILVPLADTRLRP